MPNKARRKRNGDSGSPIIVDDTSQVPPRKKMTYVLFSRGKPVDTFTATSDPKIYQVFPPGYTIGDITIPGIGSETIPLPWKMHLGNGVILFAGDETGVVLKFPQPPQAVGASSSTPNGLIFGTQIASVAVISPAPAQATSVFFGEPITIEFESLQQRKARSKPSRR